MPTECFVCLEGLREELPKSADICELLGSHKLSLQVHPDLWNCDDVSKAWGGVCQYVACCLALSGMFRRSASLAIPHLTSFTAKPCVSPVLIGRTNRNVSLSHESQRAIALV